MKRPYVWQMIREAVEYFNREVSYTEIKNYINENWGDVKSTTITDQIQVLTVNHKSRIHYPENHKERLTNSDSPYDFLYSISRGRVVKYDFNKHGIWQIEKNASNQLKVKKYEGNQSQSTFLFAWNPDNWEWANLEQKIEELEIAGKVTEKWSCISSKTVKPGDRAFLIKLGSEPRGIFASGYVVSEPFLSKHWSGVDKNVYRVLIEFEVLLNPDKELILGLNALKSEELEKQHWTPQSSGISINPEAAEGLEGGWFKFLAENSKSSHSSPDMENEKTYIEGAPNYVLQTRYERNPFARAVCLDHYGYSCSVCKLDFEKRFGEIGKKFIHVHHLNQIAKLGKAYKVDPIADLRPVCPNCHAMLHKQTPPFTIEQLKKIIDINQ